MTKFALLFKFYQGKGLLILGFTVVFFLIVLPLVVPRFLKPDTITAGFIPGLDSLPLQLGVDKPIFLENRLLLNISLFESPEERNKGFLNGDLDIVLCDLPSAILISKGGERGQIIRTVLRSNPIRPLYAIFGNHPDSLEQTAQTKDRDEHRALIVPRGLDFSYLADRLWQDLTEVNIPNKIFVGSTAEAFGILKTQPSARVLLRLPFTTLAEKEGFLNLADDRQDLIGMSVLVISLPLIQTKPQVLKRFLYAFEQTVLELNYRPDQYNNLLKEKGKLPEAIRERFPMPIYEGPNVPVESELERAGNWLQKQGLLSHELVYQKLVNLRFLPDPDRVSRAACCL